MIALKPENVVDVLFGNRLRQLLDERNISQAHFADRIGVSRSRMNNYVAQRSEPDYATLIRIANTLDTTIDFLLGKSEHQGLPQTACLSGFPDFIPSRGAGGEPPDPSCWIPLYGSQYEAPEPDAAPAAPPIRAARTGKRPARPIRSDGFATRRRQAFPLHMKIGRLPRQISSNRVNGALVADTERLHARSACYFRDAEAYSGWMWLDCTMERQSGLAQTGKEIPADCKTGSPDGN